MAARDLRSQFLLDPNITYLNHGSFGACPQPVFEAYQHWQRELEREPVDFLTRRMRGHFRYESAGLLEEARAELAAYVNAAPENIAFVPNVTIALNMVARSLSLRSGDEILTTNHEYGSIDATWTHACEKSGAIIVRHAVDLPVSTHEALIESFWSAVTERTRVIWMSHITSSTALIFPVTEICRRARETGILTVIDAAHAIGQIPVDLAAINPDFYTSNCHKWLCAPKGCAFFYAHPALQPQLEPLVISWAWVNQRPFSDMQEMWGTRDLAAYLSISAAIDFQRDNDWDAVRAACHRMAVDNRERFAALTGQPLIAPDGDTWLGQMATIALPDDLDTPLALCDRLFYDYHIEVPVNEWQGRYFIRYSIQAYNTQQDLDRLYDALVAVLG